MLAGFRTPDVALDSARGPAATSGVRPKGQLIDKNHHLLPIGKGAFHMTFLLQLIRTNNQMA